MAGTAATQSTVVGSFIRRHHAEILTAWKAAARTTPDLQALPASALVDNMPELLWQIGELADLAEQDGTSPAFSAMSRRHAVARLEEGFAVSMVVEELSLLRESVLAIWWREHAAIGGDELRVLNLAIDRAVAASVTAYMETREPTLAKLESLLAASPVGIAFLDAELRYVRINEALAELNGRPARDHVGRTVRDVLPADVADRLEPLLRRVLEAGEALMNMAVTLPDGRALLANYFPVRSPAGEVTGVGGVVLDVTDERRAQEALRVEQARLQSILEHAPAAIWVKDTEGNVVLANRRLADALGARFEDLIGRRSEELLPSDVAAQHRAHDQLVVRERRPIEVEEVVPSANGDRTFLSIKFPIPSEPPLVGGIATEITERKRMEDELRAAVRTREDVLAIVSHDLRTPLATIQLSASTLQAQGQPDPRVRRHLDMIHRASRRMETLIDDLLDTVSIRGGRLGLTMNRELAESVMAEALELARPLAAENGLDLHQHADLSGVEVMCDRTRLLQVFGNLIGNAIKFCRPGDTISVTGERAADAVRFSVADSGPGIPAHMIAHLFAAYWSGAGHTKRGSGLGLYICQGIIQGHGGRIWVEDTAGEGARFSFTLPIAA